MAKKVKLPIDCVLGITYKCNSRCIMCDIWKIKDFPEIPIEEYKKLPKSLRDINISGGEPFLRKDIVELVQILVKTCPKARIIISTNGFLSDIIERKMKEILKIKPNIGVAISVDGYEKKHEEIRGVPNAWNKCMDTLERLQKLGMKNLRLAFTILPQNVRDFSKVYNEAVKRGVEFTHSFAQSSEHYFGGKNFDNNPNLEELKKQYNYVINHELKTWRPKSWVRAFFAHGLYRFSVEKKQVLNNNPGADFFYMDPSGAVYPSVVDNYLMGNILEYKTWNDLWNSEGASKAREFAKTKGRPAWMICTARSAIKKNPYKVICWIIKNKICGKFKV